MDAAPLLFSLDLSSSVGWALMRRGSVPTFGTYRLPASAVGEHERRFVALYDWLHQSWEEHQFDAMAYEEPILPRKSGDLATTMNTLTLLWGLTAIAQLVAAQFSLPCKGVPVQQVKITVTGKANSTKDEMVVSAMQTWKWRVANDHEADAGGVGVWAYEQLFPKRAAA